MRKSETQATQSLAAGGAEGPGMDRRPAGPEASHHSAPSQGSVFRGGKGGKTFRAVKSKPGKINQKSQRHKRWHFICHRLRDSDERTDTPVLMYPWKGSEGTHRRPALLEAGDGVAEETA